VSYRENPDWDWWKKEARRRGTRAGERARRYGKTGYEAGKRGARAGYKHGRKGAKEGARRAKYGAALAAWKANEQQAAHRARSLEKCASALGYGDRVPSPGDQTIRQAHAVTARVRGQRPQLANYNPFWERKKRLPAKPSLSRDEALRRVQALGQARPLGRDQYYLVKMPHGRKTVWYFLDSLRDRAFERASPWSRPKSLIEAADPWRDVYFNLVGHRQPERYSVILLDPFEQRVVGPYDYEHVAATIQAEAAANPEAIENWAALGRVALAAAKHPAVQAAAVDITSKVGNKTWRKLKAMSVEERADWLQKAALTSTWAGGPVTRLMAGMTRRFGKKAKRKVALWVSAAMMDPEVQAHAGKLGQAGKVAVGAKYGTEIAAAKKKYLAVSNPPYARGRTLYTVAGGFERWGSIPEGEDRHVTKVSPFVRQQVALRAGGLRWERDSEVLARAKKWAKSLLHPSLAFSEVMILDADGEIVFHQERGR
jgi:hypothetical protein